MDDELEEVYVKCPLCRVDVSDFSNFIKVDNVSEETLLSYTHLNASMLYC